MERFVTVAERIILDFSREVDKVRDYSTMPDAKLTKFYRKIN